MANQYKNEVIYSGQTLMSLKEDTVTSDKVLVGETFHDRSGAPQTGTLITHNVYDGLDSTSMSDALSANAGRILNEKIITIKHKNIEMSSEQDAIRLSNYGIDGERFISAYVTNTNNIGCILYKYSTYYYLAFVNVSSMKRATGSYTVVIDYY